MPAAREAASRNCVADAMVTCPQTHAPDVSLGEIRAFFTDDHVHMALIVAADRRLVTAIERPDLVPAWPAWVPAAKVGTLLGRTARPADPLGAVSTMLLREGRRRLAVVDEFGRLLGLLCLKEDGSGYCSDDGVRARPRSRTAAEPPVAARLPWTGRRA